MHAVPETPAQTQETRVGQRLGCDSLTSYSKAASLGTSGRDEGVGNDPSSNRVSANLVHRSSLLSTSGHYKH